MGTAFHIGAYVFAVVGITAVGERTVRLVPASRKRRYDALMARIAQLEARSGLGIDYAKAWIERQPKITRDAQYVMSGKRWCYGCGEWHEARGAGLHKICDRALKGQVE